MVLGNVRSVESLALAILRLIGEEARKDRTARVIVRVPVDVGNYLLNEKREWLQGIEQNNSVSIVTVSDPGFETPNYSIRRVRDDEVSQPENASSSYRMVAPKEDPSAAYEQPKQQARTEQPAVSGILPETPAPAPSSPSERTEAPQKPRRSLWQILFGWIGGGGDSSQPRKSGQSRGGRGGGQNARRSKSRRGSGSGSGSGSGGDNRNSNARRGRSARGDSNKAEGSSGRSSNSNRSRSGRKRSQRGRKSGENANEAKSKASNNTRRGEKSGQGKPDQPKPDREKNENVSGSQAAADNRRNGQDAVRDTNGSAQSSAPDKLATQTTPSHGTQTSAPSNAPPPAPTASASAAPSNSPPPATPAPTPPAAQPAAPTPARPESARENPSGD